MCLWYDGMEVGEEKEEDDDGVSIVIMSPTLLLLLSLLLDAFPSSLLSPHAMVR